MLPLELRLLRALTLRLPPWPKMAGLAKHTARRWWLRRPRDPVLADVAGCSYATIAAITETDRAIVRRRLAHARCTVRDTIESLRWNVLRSSGV